MQERTMIVMGKTANSYINSGTRSRSIHELQTYLGVVNKIGKKIKTTPLHQSNVANGKTSKNGFRSIASLSSHDWLDSSLETHVPLPCCCAFSMKNLTGMKLHTESHNTCLQMSLLTFNTNGFHIILTLRYYS
ncbi:hypothetical protein YC2023_049916 [Brassica napus]